MGVAEFDELCRDEVTRAEFEELQFCTLEVERDPDFSAGHSSAVAGMIRFEQYLRTRIARRRAVQGREDEKNLRLPEAAEYFGEVDLAVTQAQQAADPFEREKIIDRARWRRLDELELGHDFDFEALCIYRFRLTILNKYRERKAEAGRTRFNEAVERISGAAPEA